jgi:uncharacterized membrane protein
MQSIKNFFGLTAIAAVILLPLAGYITHFIVCIANDKAALLIGGMIFFPLGIIHGWGSWFGFW